MTLRVAILLTLLVAWTGWAPPLGAQVPPDVEWSTFNTEHFRVHFAPGLEPVARRAADRAETAYAVLSRELTDPPRGSIDLLIADNVDFANGYATPFPSNRVVIYAHPPVDEPSLAFYDDWLQLVITHELVHIFHLDEAGGVWDPLRRVFGRSPLLFPQLFTPGWVTEGLATYFESRLTGAGRVRGTEHEMALRTAILDSAFFGIDQVSGTPTTWPGPRAQYVYGSLFFAHLADRYGPERIPEYVDRVGRRLLPFGTDGNARRTFGQSFSREWNSWRDSLRTRYEAFADSLRAEGLTEPEILTEAGRFALFPRYGPDGQTIAYAAATGREEASLRLIYPSGEERTIAPRLSLGPATWLPQGQALLLSQLDYEDPYHLLAEVYRVELGGDREQLTDGARIMEPHLGPDGRSLVAVQSAGGTNALVVLDLETGEIRRLREPELGTHWSLPRWSPGGDRIAVARWRAGGFLDIVVLDTAGAVLREITHDRAVDNAPAWTPDGRFILFSSDRTGISNLYAYEWERDRILQVTNVLTGAFQPDVSGDGRSIAFSLYRANGYHIARIPAQPAAWRPAPPVRAEVAAPPADPAVFDATAGGPERPYSPWPSLLPTAWTPTVGSSSGLGVALGAGIVGADVVQRHLYGAFAQVYPRGGEVEGALAYRYRGLGNPLLDLELSQDWLVARRASPEDSVPSEVLRRDRTAGASLTWIRPRLRSLWWVAGGGDVRETEYTSRDSAALGGPDSGLRAVPLDVGATLGFGYSSVREYAFSISPEDGFLLSLSSEGRRYTEAFAGTDEPPGYLRFTTRNRGYRAFDVWGFARHVLALRLGAGIETGDLSPGFVVGGESGSGNPLPLPLGSLGRSVAYPIRGYSEAAQFGNRAASLSAEYRFPLTLVERGFRTLPLFVDRLWGAAFSDVGGAWCVGCESRFPSAPTKLDPLYSVGAELGVDLTVGYYAGLTVRGGFAVPLADVSDLDRDTEPQLYLRLGRSF